MRNRANTIEEESFFPSITDLMVGIIFIFIIIVMALILQIKDEQQSIPKPLFEKIINLDQQKQTELDILIDEIEDIDQRIKDLANEKIKNIELREKLQKAEEKIQDQSDEINKKIIIELKNDKLIEELDLIKNDLNIKIKELNLLNSKFNNLNNQINDIPILENKIDILKNKITFYQENIQSDNDFKNQLQKKLEEINILKKQNDSLLSKNNEVNDIILSKSLLQDDNKILQKELLNLKNEIENLQNNDLKQITEAEILIDKVNKLKEEATKTLLDEIKILFKEKNINITIDYPNSKFILSSKKLFSSGNSKLLPEGVDKINKITDVFEKILPCFSYEPYYLAKSTTLNNTKKTWEKINKKNDYKNYCNSNKLKISNYFKIDTLMIEGHTDQDNRKVADEEELSTKRALSTFKKMEERQILITGLTNKKGEPIFGYSGYGRTRPLIENAKTETEKSKNRRLEFRFIFGEPEKTIVNEIIRDLQNAS